jgi:hypothetical protein
MYVLEFFDQYNISNMYKSITVMWSNIQIDNRPEFDFTRSTLIEVQYIIKRRLQFLT